ISSLRAGSWAALPGSWTKERLQARQRKRCLPYLVYPCRMVLLLPQWRYSGVRVISSSIMLLSVPNNTSGTTTTY
ncbi:MAG TPA: hypothetical protein VNA27_03340, partial [Rubrobacteraceae bacterium]|nr:hypothetical protein [Rubrobacteraceae bacterium]